MKISSMCAALLTAVTCLVPLASRAIEVERYGLYVVSDDLQRSSAFYQSLFGAPPRVRTPALLGFDVAGGFYAVVAKDAYAPNAKVGANVVPYIRVKNIQAEFDRVKAFAPTSLRTPSVVDEGAFRFFRFSDPDGNLIEFFSVTAPSSS